MSSLLRSLRPGRRHDRRSRADAPSVFDPAKQEEGRAPFMLQLGDKYSLVYDDGEWTAEKMPLDSEEAADKAKLALENRRLRDENRLLKYKLEVLIDMVTVAKVEASTRAR